MEEFNYNEINKRAIAPNLLKSYGIDIEKAEGSKGGNVIGHTKSGKPIYAHSGHEGHMGFSSEDHNEAAALHSKKAENRFGYADKTDDKKLSGSHEMAGMEHEKNAKYHKQMASDMKSDEKKSVSKGDTMKVDTQEIVDEHKKLVNTLKSPSKKDDKEEAEKQEGELKEYEKKLSKAFETLGVDYIEKAEGSRGGKIIDHTKSGKPIYADSMDRPTGHFSVEDHHEAANLHDKMTQADHSSYSKERNEKKVNTKIEHHRGQRDRHIRATETTR